MAIVHTEYIDPHGYRVVRQLLGDIDEDSLDAKKRQRLQFLIKYLDGIDDVYGPEITGPIGLRARPLTCTYRRIRNGRLHCNMCVGPKWSESDSSYICAQGMPNVLRPYLMQKWGHDLDIENCHVVLMYQLGSRYHEWTEHGLQTVPALSLHVMKQLYEDRDAFIEEVADFHSIPTDSEQYPGYRKDLVKPLLLRILYGGSYDMWLKDNNLSAIPKSIRVIRLERELTNLRDAVLRSKKFEWLVKPERVAQQRRSRSREAIDRGIFSKVAQHLECEVLLAMRQYLMNKGWEIHSLIFDGLIVGHRPGMLLDMRLLERYIERQTDFAVRVVEKPLYRYTPTRQKLLLH